MSRIISLIMLFILLSPVAYSDVLLIDATASTSGRVQNTSMVNYITGRNTATASTAQDLDTITAITGQSYTASTWSTYRSIFRFDTEGLPDDCTIDSVLVVFVPSYENSDYDFRFMLVDCEDTTSTGYFGVESFNNFTGWAESGAYSPTVISDSLSSTIVTVDDTLTLRLNTVGKGKVSKTAITQCMLVTGHDLGSIDPKTGAEPQYIGHFIIYAETIYMKVYYNGSVSGYSRKVNEITVASVNGIATTSINSVNEVP